MSTESRPTPVNGIVITFFSTASAVGKTLVACNMASELAREGYRVCLADFDLQFGDVCHFLKLQPERHWPTYSARCRSRATRAAPRTS